MTLLIVKINIVGAQVQKQGNVTILLPVMSHELYSTAGMLLRSLQRFSDISLGFLLTLTAMLALFVHKVSPLRDPAFQPNSANGGSLIPQLRGWSDGDWVLGATILAGLLAVNLTIALCGSRASRNAGSALSLAIGFMVGLVCFGILRLTFIGYLLSQWLID